MPSIPSVEPRFARIAAAIGDPTRVRMLSVLLGGVSLPAGEIAQAAGVNASTASQHLALLLDEGLVAMHARGRHRYFRVSDADVARALEALSLVAERASGGERYAYPCLDWSERRDHLAGRLATGLLDHFMARRWLVRVRESRALKLTPQGRRALLPLL
jgi:DNA-binding transcriptional ArsR family regulator